MIWVWSWCCCCWCLLFGFVININKGCIYIEDSTERSSCVPFVQHICLSISFIYITWKDYLEHISIKIPLHPHERYFLFIYMLQTFNIQTTKEFSLPTLTYDVKNIIFKVYDTRNDTVFFLLLQYTKYVRLSAWNIDVF